ncbi:helix-hairpin-helix domain-containing protein [Lactiplantibacillus daowaiensis]|uniref:Helix-hairpin-helix domain-containing protein n=1 Tax=Lactiplantibacillus daowaiensis TaxID=2559918 RepID=A0ABW1RYV9_9LACO|nr:helix-hairpin-helix domain-containing protein [Lactiplantibacillus daowaiensis]
METNVLAWLKAHPRLAWILGGGGAILMSLMVILHLAQRPAPVVGDAALASSQVLPSQAAGSSRSSATAAPTATQRGAAATTSSSSGPMYVDVKGAVHQPGIYQVKASMRVADVIAMAKGLAPKADRLQVNLAEKVTDQQVIYVPKKGEKSASVAGSTTGTANSSGPVATTSGTKTAASSSSTGGNGGTQINLNTANVTELQQLSGVGQKKAEKIIEYRDTHDGFKSVDDLKQVSGIGDKTLEKFRSQLTV